MPPLTTKTVIWDEKKTAMEMEIPLTPVPMAVDGLQAPISPFSLESSPPPPPPPPSPSPSLAQRTEKQGEQENKGKGDSSSIGSIVVVGPSGSNNTSTNTDTHIAELAASLARALSYTEGYDLERGKQTQQQGMNDVYELQTLTRYPSVRAARHHQPMGVKDSYYSPRPISRRVRAERRTRRYLLV